MAKARQPTSLPGQGDHEVARHDRNHSIMLFSRVQGEMGDGWEVVVLFSHLQESSNLVYSHLFLHKLCTDGVTPPWTMDHEC